MKDINNNTLFSGKDHPNPGVPYYCYFCTFYLPDNKEGRELCILLRRVFNTYFMFTIAENSVVCNDLELKTSREGGPAKWVRPFLHGREETQTEAWKGITKSYLRKLSVFKLHWDVYIRASHTLIDVSDVKYEYGKKDRRFKRQTTKTSDRK